MDFLEKQKTLRQIQEVNPGLIGLLSAEEIEEIYEALKNGASIEELVGTAEKATLRAAASVEVEKRQGSEENLSSESESKDSTDQETKIQAKSEVEEGGVSKEETLTSSESTSKVVSEGSEEEKTD